ncbi:MAG: hypothetical protein IK015_03490 [Treponema sp.]|nr:hypothetical protein [Treponema sp.]
MFVKKGILIFLFCAVCALPFFAEWNSFDIPDSAEIRRQVSREWFEGSLDVVRGLNSEIRSNQVGTQFQIRLEEQQEVFLVIAAPKSQMKVDIYEGNGVRAAVEDSYNMDSPGSWLLVRSKQNGAPESVRYYFAKDAGVYVQFRPDQKGKSSLADMVIFDNYAARGVPLGVPFERFYTASFAEIQALTKSNLPWASVEPKSGLYDDTLVMIQTIRGSLGNIAYQDDAAYNEEGKPVSVRNGQIRYVPEDLRKKLTLSSPGFVKWICDGIVEPLAGSYLKMKPLVQPTFETNPTGAKAVMGANYSTSFSLDWTRNLAAAVLSVRNNKTVLYKDSGVDVSIEPFAVRWTDKGFQNAAGYIANTGYRVQYLKPLLYVLATKYPQYFYLAAIRQTDRGKGGNEFSVFNDAAAIFPYFDADGKFKAVVFYDGREYSLQQFCSSFEKSNGAFVHLVRVKTSAKFYPQEPVKEKENDRRY